MGRGGDRNYPGGKRSGPKPKMDKESVAKREKRQESNRTSAQRCTGRLQRLRPSCRRKPSSRGLWSARIARTSRCACAAILAASASPIRRRQLRRRQQLLRQHQLPSYRRARWTPSFRSHQRQICACRDRDVGRYSCLSETVHVCLRRAFVLCNNHLSAAQRRLMVSPPSAFERPGCMSACSPKARQQDLRSEIYIES